MGRQTGKASIRWNKSLRIRLTIVLFLAPVILAAVMIFISLRLFNERIINEKAEKAEMLTRIVAQSINGDSIDRYLATHEKDDEYVETLEMMRTIQNNSEVLYIYVVRVESSGFLFVFDADEDESTHVELGVFDEWFGDSSSITYEEFVELSKRSEPIRDISYSEWGWLLTVFEPIYRSDGSITAFVCVDISMDGVMLEMHRLVVLVSFIVSAFFIMIIVINIATIQGWIFKPIKDIVDRISDFRFIMVSSGELPELQTEQEKYSGNELQVLESALSAMQAHIEKGFAEKTKALDFHTSMLDTLFDSIPDLIFTKDLNSVYTMCNKSFADFYGFEKHEIIGKGDFGTSGIGVTEEEAATYKKSDIIVINERKTIIAEEMKLHVNGLNSFHETVKIPLIVKDEVVGVLGISRDITKRKEMERTVEENYNYSKELTNTLVKIAESPSYSTGDLKAALELISLNGCIALNTSRVGIWSIDKDIEILKSIAYYDRATQTHSANVSMDIKERVEYIELLKTERLIVINNAMIPNPLSDIFERYYGPELRATLDAPIKIGGKLVGVVCIEQDETEKYPSSREWTIEEQNFASSLADFAALSMEGNERRILAHRTELLMNSLPGMVFQAENNPPDFTLKFLSEGCFALTGYTREEILGLNPGENPIGYFDIVYPDDLQGLKKQIEETLLIGMPLETTYRIITKYGAIKWIWDRSHVTDYDENGNPLTLEGFYTDITEQRRLEAAEAASHAKSEFLSNMSHEMRTPLNAIVGMTAIGKKTGDVEGKIHALNKIGDASSHLLGMVNDILDMAKIEANRLELLSAEYHFEHMIEKVMTMIHFRAEEKQQTLTVEIDKNIPRFVIGDDQRLSQVLINILWNAVKFTQSGGNIHMDVSLSKKRTTSCELRVEITDNGIGISREQQSKLFEVFEQADSKTGRAYGGTGLGLAIAKRIIEMMDGKIWVESELGDGAKFVFTVFVGTVKDAVSSVNSNGTISYTADMKSGAFAGKHLLVAEDVEINRDILIALLEDTGLIIDCAENGKEAVDMITADVEKYDIVLMDLQMPQMDGFEATRQIRALPLRKKGKIPIIAMTANVFKDDIEACLAAGMDDHLGKPLDIDKVMEKLTRHLMKEGKQ